jgi:ribosomal protein S18 acetylase RimI-like enzyme
MVLRPAGDGDRDAVLALGLAEEAAWFGEAAFGADDVAEWIDDEGGLAAGVVAVDDDGRVCGFASPGRHEGVFVADTTATDAVADVLVPWLREQRGDVQISTYAGDAPRVAAFERLGLRRLRSQFMLIRADDAGPLPAAEIPEGVEIAPYRLGEDDEAVHRLVFVDAEWTAVPGHTHRDFEAWRAPLHRNSALFLARRDDRPVGLVVGRVLDSGRGFVDTLAVATTERGRGLGRALLLRAFADLQRAGARGLTLGVQAQNERALGLYRSVGLEIEQEFRVYAGV